MIKVWYIKGEIKGDDKVFFDISGVKVNFK